MPLTEPNPNTTWPASHQTRLKEYLNACGITSGHQEKILVALATQQPESKELHALMRELHQICQSFQNGNNTDEKEADHVDIRLKTYLATDVSHRFWNRAWSTPPIRRTHMAPKDYTPNIIKKLKQLAGRRPASRSTISS